MRAEITTNCMLCRSERIKKFFISQNQHGRHLIDSKDEFSVFSCLDCGSVFLGGLNIDSEYYKKYYDSGYYRDAGISLFSNFSNLLFKFSVYRKQKLILSSLKKNEKRFSILDVGCGAGGFLLQLDDKKFIKNGVEINREGADICKKKGLKIYEQDLMSINFSNKFDVISMWHVLEHLSDPVAMLKKIHSILSDKGILIFEVPNTDSLGFRYGRKNWFHLDSPRHLILFNKRSIIKLCELSGFRVECMKNEFYDYPLDLFWSIRKSKIRFLFYPLYPIIKFFSRETLTFICKKI